MFLIEPERGCSRGCNYCVMRRTTNGGMRTVPPERVLELMPAWAPRVGLVGAAVTDHPRIVELLRDARRLGPARSASPRCAPTGSPRRWWGAQARRGASLTVASDGASAAAARPGRAQAPEEQILSRGPAARKAAGLKRAQGLQDGRAAGRRPTRTSTSWCASPRAVADPPGGARGGALRRQAQHAARRRALRRHRRGGGAARAAAQAALKGKAEVRPTSARWAWVEYMLAQGGPEAGLAAFDAGSAGGSFAAYRRAFEARGCRPFEACRVSDGRRDAVAWPTVGPKPATVLAAG